MTEPDNRMTEAEAVDRHADNWRNVPPGDQVPEWLERRNDDADTSPARNEAGAGDGAAGENEAGGRDEPASQNETADAPREAP